MEKDGREGQQKFTALSFHADKINISLFYLRTDKVKKWVPIGKLIDLKEKETKSKVVFKIDKSHIDIIVLKKLVKTILFHILSTYLRVYVIYSCNMCLSGTRHTTLVNMKNKKILRKRITENNPVRRGHVCDAGAKNNSKYLQASPNLMPSLANKWNIITVRPKCWGKKHWRSIRACVFEGYPYISSVTKYRSATGLPVTEFIL